MNISNEDWVKILDAIATNKYTDSLLDLRNLRLNGAEIRELGIALNTNIYVKDLILPGNALGEDTDALSALLSNSRLRVLSLSNNNLGDQSAMALAKFLENNNTLERLILSSNQIGDYAGAFLVRSLEKNEKLKFLGLSGNDQIGPQTAMALQAALLINKIIETVNVFDARHTQSGGVYTALQADNRVKSYIGFDTTMYETTPLERIVGPYLQRKAAIEAFILDPEVRKKLSLPGFFEDNLYHKHALEGLINSFLGHHTPSMEESNVSKSSASSSSSLDARAIKQDEGHKHDQNKTLRFTSDPEKSNDPKESKKPKTEEEAKAERAEINKNKNKNKNKKI